MSEIIKYKGYRASVEYDSSEKLLVGRVLGIKDVIGFSSGSAKNVEKEFHKIIDEYLDFCKEVGKTPEREYSGCFNVRVAPETHRDASINAENSHITLNQYVCDALDYYNKMKYKMSV